LAGLGRKEFNSGDILLASEVQGYLQDQAVMVFDDATARGSAIPSPSEGMVTYTKDDDAIQVYDGSAFVGVGSDSGLIHIETRTVTAAALESFNNVFTSTYDNYKVVGHLTTSVSGQSFSLRFRVGGSDNTASSYQRQRAAFASTSFTGTAVTNLTLARVGTIEDTKTDFVMEIYTPNLALNTGLTSLLKVHSSTSIFSEFNACAHSSTTVFDGFSVFPDTGNFTGTMSIYGYAKA
jgi:hypothetical protein